MAFLGLALNHATARLLGSIEVPGVKTPLDQMHITLLYLGEDIPIKVIAKAVEATYAVTSKQTPFNIKTSKVKCFPTSDDKPVPIIAPVLSPELHSFQKSLRAQFDKLDVPYSKLFPEYKPHVTLSYNDSPIKEMQLPEPIQWAGHEATLWAGDDGDERLSVNFPFTLKAMKEFASCVKTLKKSGSCR